MNQWRIFAAVATAVLFVTAPTWALDESRDSGASAGVAAATPPMAGQAQNLNVVRADKIIGKDVKNAKDETLGKVRELVLGPSLRKISYAVVSSGGTLGMGEKYHAVPFEAIKVSSDSKHVVLNLDKKRFEDSPSFDKEHWPDFGDSHYTRELQGYYGASSTDIGAHDGDISYRFDGTEGSVRSDEMASSRSAYGDVRTEESELHPDSLPNTPSDKYASSRRDKLNGSFDGETSPRDTAADQNVSKGFSARKLSDVIGLNVKTSDNQNLGEINDIAFTADRGHLVYGIINYGGVLGMGEKTVVVPWESININTRNHVARVNADKAKLESLAVESDKLPDLSDRAFAQRTYGAFDQQPYWEVLGYGGGAVAFTNEAWKPDSSYSKLFKSDQVKTYTGTIQNVGTFKPDPQSAPGLRLRLRTDQGQLISVHVGPAGFVDSKGVVFNYGDKITVKGASADFQGNQVLIASEIKKGDQTLTLRDDKGTPKWDLNMLSGSDHSTTHDGSSDSGIRKADETIRE